MVLVSYSGKEINAKLVYYGPGLSGKTTNLEYIYGSIPGNHRGKMVSMKTKTERTLFFDFLPVQLGELSGFKTRFLLYTVPGQVYYNATRKLVLKGVDAVVFVADSKRGKMDENVESLENLKENLREHGLDVNTIPWVLQYNKRDLPEVYSIQELDQVLNPMKVPTFEAVATNGNGVIDTFKGVSRLLLKKLSAEVGVPIVSTGDGPGAGVGTAPASSGAPQGGTAAKAPNQLAQLQTPQPPTAPPQAPSTQPARPVATSAAQTPSTSTDEANTPPISRSSAPPVSNAASPSTPPSTPPSSTGQSPQAASSGSRSLGGITRSDGSSSDDPPMMGAPQVFETNASLPDPATPAASPKGSLASSDGSTPPGSSGTSSMSSMQSVEDEMPPISRMQPRAPEPAQGGMRQRLARWLKRGDDAEETDSRESTTSDSAHRGFFDSSDPASETTAPSSAFASHSLAGREQEEAEGTGETFPSATAPVPPPFGSDAPSQGRESGSANAGTTSPSAVSPMTPRTESPSPTARAGGQPPAPVSTPAPEPAQAPMTQEPVAPVAAVPQATPSASATGAARADQPRELVVPVRLRPEDLATGVIVKLKIETVDTSSSGKKAA